MQHGERPRKTEWTRIVPPTNDLIVSHGWRLVIRSIGPVESPLVLQAIGHGVRLDRDRSVPAELSLELFDFVQLVNLALELTTLADPKDDVSTDPGSQRNEERNARWKQSSFRGRDHHQR